MNAINKRPSPYVLGSIWKRRDGERVVVMSGEENGLVRVANYQPDQSYLVYADSGRLLRVLSDTPMDLIYRDED